MQTRILLISLLLIPAPAMAGDSLAMGSAIVQMVWALLVVVGIILILFAIARKRFGLGQAGPGAIKIVEMRHLMPKSTLALVEVRDRELLLGIGGGKIELLADLSNPPKATASFKTMLEEEK